MIGTEVISEFLINSEESKVVIALLFFLSQAFLKARRKHILKKITLLSLF